MYICVFCYTEANEHSCPQCGEYKGIMPHEEADDYMNPRSPEELASFEQFIKDNEHLMAEEDA